MQFTILMSWFFLYARFFFALLFDSVHQDSLHAQGKRVVWKQRSNWCASCMMVYHHPSVTWPPKIKSSLILVTPLNTLSTIKSILFLLIIIWLAYWMWKCGNASTNTRTHTHTHTPSQCLTHHLSLSFARYLMLHIFLSFCSFFTENSVIRKRNV